MTDFTCPDAMTLSLYDTRPGWEHLIQTRCSRWTCRACAPLKQRLLCKRIGEAEPNRLITLTCGSPKGRTPEEVWHATRRQVPELIRRIRKEVGPIEYCRVMETHKSGYPHFHLVARSDFIQAERMSRWWQELTEAYIVDIRAIRSKQNVARYVGKYITKQLHVPFTQRRVTWSKGFFQNRPSLGGEEPIWGDMIRLDERMVDVIQRRGLVGQVIALSPDHVVVQNDDDGSMTDYVLNWYRPNEASGPQDEWQEPWYSDYDEELEHHMAAYKPPDWCTV